MTLLAAQPLELFGIRFVGINAKNGHKLLLTNEKYGVMARDFEPRVYWRLTDNWLELTVRFIVADHGIRDVKDAMSRRVLAALDEAKIGVASSGSELTIIGLPPVTLRRSH